MTTEAPTTTRDGDRGTTTTSPISSDTTTDSEEATSVEVTTSTASSTSESTAIPSAINGNNPSNESFSEQPPIEDGELPLQPRLTPGWGVSGAIMLITGVVYALIGIKNPWLHTFFSSAYLASLSVTVLIVYVMSPPISDGIQGAYVVAAVCTGIIVGGAATVFKELTEGLGCLLGGFCFAMWLLTLREGGLLPTTVGKVIFITAFTLVGFAFYFSRHTRPYALIGLMSFAGATVSVLGIDCFSRAGLKEFWAYIWNLNDNLFPFEADTYPLTKGIRVEIAIIVVLTVLGLISQLKLWRVVQEHRTKRDEEQAEFQRMRDEEEAVIGRQIEENNERERRQWETTYGDLPPSESSRDSGVGEIENEKKGRLSQSTVQPISPSATDNENTIEMTDLQPSEDGTSSQVAKRVENGLVVAEQNESNQVTVRVSRDDCPNSDDDGSPMPEPDEKAWIAGIDEKGRPSSMISPSNSRRFSNLAGPDITPLPFKVPEPHGEEEEDKDDEDRSTVATFADEDERSITLSKRASRASLSHRLSMGSAHILRSFSQRSQKSKRQTGEFESTQLSLKNGESVEDLVPRKRSVPEDSGSIAATADGLSTNGDEKTESGEVGESNQAMEIKAELADRLPTDKQIAADNMSAAQPEPADPGTQLNTRPYSTVETAAADILKPSLYGISELHNSPTATEAKAPSDTSKAAKSTSSASLTKERLPSSLSRVALSYRTNEWAKHLSLAEKPEPDHLQLNEYPKQEEIASPQAEAPVPVKVDELQQTSESGVPAAPIVRSPSSLSHTQSAVTFQRSPSGASIPGGSNILQSAAPSVPLADEMQETTDRPGLTKGTQLHSQTNHNARMKNRRQPGDAIIQPILEEKNDEHLSTKTSQEDLREFSPNPSPPLPGRPDTQNLSRSSIPGVVSYSSPQTLMGQRETYIRTKSQSTLILSPPIPEATQYAPRPATQMDLYNYSPPVPLASQDADDLPLSQRKELMRQNSMLSDNSIGVNHRPSNVARASFTLSPSAPIMADNLKFDSHQPQRRSTVSPQAIRDSKLANFRQSVAAELRAGTPILPVGINGRETPLRSSSTPLLGATGMRTGNNEIQNSIDQQRNLLLSQREQEAQRKELERREKERNERAFEEMMRRGDLMDAHREAIRRMQGTVRD